MATTFAVVPLTAPPRATVEVPGSKSHTNRALVCAALAEGESTLHRVLSADDTTAMLGALRSLGVGLDPIEGTSTVVVHGLGGPPRLRSAGTPTIDVNQSGTTSRFLLPVLALADGPSVLDGHEQLRARPFGDLVDALRTLGARVDGDVLPIRVEGGGLSGGEVQVPGTVSSQFLSGLLLAAPLADAPVTIRVVGGLVSVPYVELTLSTMAAFGVSVERRGDTYVVPSGGYRAAVVDLEPDASAASYFFAAAALTGGTVRVEGLGTDSIQGDVAFVDVLERMGAIVERSADAIEVTGPERLRGIDVDMSDISDTAQTLAAIAPFADGPTRVTGIGFIRRKEIDRIRAVVTQLRARGVDAIEDEDGFTINPGPITPGVVETSDDHRMAMSFALLGLVEPGIEIADPGCVAKTFPTYFEVLDQLRV